MSKKLTSLHLPNNYKDALVIARECLPAGKAVANPDNILRSALFEGRNHKIASVVRLHDRPLEFIKPQIIRDESYNIPQAVSNPNSCHWRKKIAFLSPWDSQEK